MGLAGVQLREETTGESWNGENWKIVSGVVPMVLWSHAALAGKGRSDLGIDRRCCCSRW